MQEKVKSRNTSQNKDVVLTSKKDILSNPQLKKELEVTIEEEKDPSPVNTDEPKIEDVELPSIQKEIDTTAKDSDEVKTFNLLEGKLKFLSKLLPSFPHHTQEEIDSSLYKTAIKTLLGE
jgi:hypothetical protein